MIGMPSSPTERSLFRPDGGTEDNDSLPKDDIEETSSAGLLTAIERDGPLEPQEKKDVLRAMLLIRGVDQAWGDAYLNREVEGTPPALGMGQEAVPAGTCAALELGDFQFTHHRGQGPMVASGLDPKRIMADLYMRVDGYNKGKSYHVTDVSRGVIGMGGIIGVQVGVAGGKALEQQYSGKDAVSVAYVGDGASNEGVVHEMAVLAAMWDLPLIIVVENNEYNITQRADEAIQSSSIASRAAGYGITGRSVDGNNPLAVYRAVSDARNRALDGAGSTLLEARTTRMGGHLTHDPQKYRSAGEVADSKAQDPIKRFRERLLAAEILTETEFDELKADVTKTVESAVEFARESPHPEPPDAYEDVWV